ncbi:hypothetical protein M413DRAFT_14985 [Hebeloma cylindrosporum]|uniref:DUF1899 domain-containing protein n=1 Tax=Hebeloma cylindrosporum TaxID=76867 RepID=A0A0C3BCN3_HEBCY|nr:hypothetical protein M413DRAFT_14985 [Hebeloma cylindrosporum h7]
MSERQVGIWETGGLANVKTIGLDQSAGVVMPFWTDNNILFLAGKGDGNIRYYEYDSDTLYALDEHKSSEPQRGMCFLPRRALRIADCEIARAYKVHGSSIEPIAFIVPRKADSFQSDIFPPAPSIEPSLSASEFFNGKVVPRKLVDLSNGSTLDGPKPSAAPSFSAATPATPATPASASPYAIQPTRTFSASAPTPAAAPQPAAISIPEPKRTFSTSPSPTPVTAAEVKTPARSQTIDNKDDLAAENQRLEGELRDAREKIRNLEGDYPCPGAVE